MPISATNTKEPRFKDAIWYAAAAGAVVGLGAPAAHAQIVYQDINPDFTVQDTGDDFGDNFDNPYPIDFDGDGNPEILFGEESDRDRIIGIFDETEEGGEQDEDRVIRIVGTEEEFDGVLYPYFLPVEAGSTISSGVASLSASFATFTFVGYDPNSFIGAGEKYIGVSFELGEGTVHNAWLRVEVPAEGGALIVKDYAFNATPDEPIEAGEGMVLSNEGETTGLDGALARIDAYPNPFADALQFKLEVAAAQEVEVAVYDVLGRQVAVLHDGALAAGSQHAFTLEGAGLPNGLYLIQAKGEQFTETTRVTLAR